MRTVIVLRCLFCFFVVVPFTLSLPTPVWWYPVSRLPALAKSSWRPEEQKDQHPARGGLIDLHERSCWGVRICSKRTPPRALILVVITIIVIFILFVSQKKAPSRRLIRANAFIYEAPRCAQEQDGKDARLLRARRLSGITAAALHIRNKHNRGNNDTKSQNKAKKNDHSHDFGDPKDGKSELHPNLYLNDTNTEKSDTNKSRMIHPVHKDIRNSKHANQLWKRIKGGPKKNSQQVFNRFRKMRLLIQIISSYYNASTFYQWPPFTPQSVKVPEQLFCSFFFNTVFVRTFPPLRL